MWNSIESNGQFHKCKGAKVECTPRNNELNYISLKSGQRKFQSIIYSWLQKNNTFNQNETLHLNFDIVLMRSGGLIAQESVILIIFSENSKTTNNIISVIKIVPNNKLNDWTEKTASWNLNVAIDSRHSKKTQRKRENISSIDDRICFNCTEK